MSTRIAFVAGALLCALCLAYTWRQPVLAMSNSAMSNSPLFRRQSQNQLALRQDWRLGHPASYENLTLWAVLSDRSFPPGEFITLDEGVRTGKVTITELGAQGQTRTLRPGEQVEDEAEVNKLSLVNNSGKDLILIAGEMIIGGQQDRIDASDRIIPSTGRPLPIDVFCIEPDRWSGTQSFGQSQMIADDGSGRQANRSGASPATLAGGSGTSAGPGMGVGSGSSGGLGPASAGGVGSGSGTGMANLSVREKAEAKKDQSEVWQSVSTTKVETLAILNSAEVVTVSGGTSSLNGVYNDKAVEAKLEGYEKALSSSVAAQNVVGVVVAVNGQIEAADIFGSHELFETYWPKLLKSYEVEAVSAAGQKAHPVKPPTSAAALAFIRSVEGRFSSEGQTGLYKLIKRESETSTSFELDYSGSRTPMLVHFNRVVSRVKR
ncbi:MAG TPA: DUF6569 family protein [Blastocatellia bacterium]|nr:DUF6569 family protein [Blastocatellia bacterium]